MAVSQNSSKFTFTVKTTVTRDDTKCRYKVVSKAILTVKVWRFIPGSNSVATITVKNGDTGTGKIKDGGTYGDNKTNKSYTLATATAYYDYSKSARTVKISASSSKSVDSGGYGPGKLSYSGSVSLPARYSTAGNLTCSSVNQASAKCILSGLPKSVGYRRIINWYLGSTKKGSTDISGGSTATSSSYTFTGLQPNTTYTFKAMLYASDSDDTDPKYLEDSVTKTTPNETGSLELDAGTTYVLATVSGMYSSPNYTRNLKFYYKDTASSNYIHYATVTSNVSGAGYGRTITDLVSNNTYDIKVDICNGSTVLKSLTGRIATIKDTSLVPVGIISRITQKLGTRELTVSWTSSKSVAGTKYELQYGVTGEISWSKLIDISSSPVVVNCPVGNKDVLFRIKSTNPVAEGVTQYSESYSLYVRDDFLWDVPKEIGRVLEVTANEWNRLGEYAIAKLTQKGKTVSIPKVKKGDPLTSGTFNTMKNYIDQISPTGITDKRRGDAISMADINKLKECVNKS